MKTKIKALKNGVELEFNLRGTCKFGGISAEEIIAKLLDEKMFYGGGNSGALKMLQNKCFKTNPVENEVILISASFQMLGLKGDEYTNQAKYTSIMESALGALVEYSGKKYLVSECPNEIGPHFCLQHSKLTPEASLVGEDMIVMDQKILLDNTSYGFFIVKKKRGQPQLTCFVNDNYQTWYAYIDFVFCLKEK